MARINTELTLDTSQFQRSIATATAKLEKFAKSAQAMGTTLTQNLSLPILGVGAAAVKSFGDIERLENALTAIMGSSEAAATELDKLRKVAENPGLALPEVVKASASLQSVGFSADNARATIEQFGNAVARSGGNAETFDGVILALSQISAVGQVTQEDLNQIKERLPEFARVMKDEFGVVTAEAIRELGVSSEEFIARSVGALSKLERANGGISNAFDNFKDSVAGSLAVLGESIATSINLEGILATLSNGLARLTAWFKGLSPTTQKVIVVFAGIVAAVGPILFIIGKLAGAWGVMVLGFGKAVKVFQAVKVAFIALQSSIFAIPAAIAGVIVVVGLLYTKFEGVRKVVNGVGMAFVELARLAKDSFSKIVLGIQQLTAGEFKAAASSFGSAIGNLNPVSLGKTFAKGFAEGFQDSTDYLSPMIDNIKQQVQNAANQFTFTGATGTPTGGGGGKGSSTAKIESPIKPEIWNIEPLTRYKEEITLTNEEFAKLGETVALAQANSALGIEQTNLRLQDTRASLELAALAAANAGQALANWENPGQFILTLGEAAQKAGEAFAQVAVDGELSFRKLGRAALESARQVVAAYIKEAVAGVVKNVLAGPLGKLGPLAIGIAAATGGAAAALFNGLLNKIAPPKLATGGLAYGQTLAVVGDNPNAGTDPEVIAPLSKLKDYMNGGGGYFAEARISGSDLLILVTDAERRSGRIR